MRALRRTEIARLAVLLAILAQVAWCRTVSAQEGGLEVLEGETLYQEGWLFTLSHSFKQKSRLFREDDRIRDPLDRIQSDHRVSAGVNYGLRPDLTVSALFPVVFRSLDSKAGDLSADGPGDVAIFSKWRVYRETGNRSSDNIERATLSH